MLHCQLLNRASGLSGQELYIYLPPGGESLLEPVARILIENTGRTNCLGPNCQENGEILLITAIEDTRMERNEVQALYEKIICQIDSLIDQFISNHTAIKNLRIENGQLVYTVNYRALIIDLHYLLNRLKPFSIFVEANGGWYDQSSHSFPGFDAFLVKQKKKEFDPEAARNFNGIFEFFTRLHRNVRIGKALLSGENTQSIGNAELKDVMIDVSCLLKQVNPLISFISSHGGWYNQSLDSFPGFDSFLQMQQNKDPNLTTEEQTSCIQSIENFAKVYLYLCIYKMYII